MAARTKVKAPTLRRVLHEHGWLSPASLVFFFTAFALLFGFLYDRQYFGHFGVDVASYTSYTHFLSAPFREPITAVWAAVATFVGLVDLWILLTGRFKGKLQDQIIGLLTSFVLFYAVYLMVTNAADSAAERLPVVTVSKGIGAQDKKAYLLIGRIGSSTFLCDASTGKTVVLETGNITSEMKSGTTRRGKSCWIEAQS